MKEDFNIPEGLQKQLKKLPQTSRMPEFNPSWLTQEPYVRLNAVDIMQNRVPYTRYFTVAALISVFLGGFLFYKLNTSVPPAVAKANPLKVLVLSVSGKVTKADQSTLVRGMFLNEQDEVITHEGGRVDLAFSRERIMRVEEKSRLKINEAKKGETSSTVKVDLKQGSIVNSIEKLTKGDTFEIHTPTAIAGVRGTFFKVSLINGKVFVATLNGSVEVTADGKSRILKQEEALTYEASGGFLELSSEDLQSEMKKAQATEKEIVTIVQNTDWITVESVQKEKEVILTEEQIKQMYNKGFEVITLRNGTVIRGAVVSQGEGNLVIHTEKGKVILQKKDVLDIQYE